MSWLKSALTSPLGNSCLSAFVGAAESFGSTAHLVRVLTYHRVDHFDPNDTRPYDPSLISATPAEFAEQMEWIARHDLAVSMDEFLAALDGAPLKPGAVLITFDDANRCFAKHAWPILRERGLPATVFVPTNFPHASHSAIPRPRFWWDRIYASVMQTDRERWIDDRGDAFDLSSFENRRAVVRQMATRVKSMPHDQACEWIDEVCEQLSQPLFENNILSWDELRALADDGVTLAPHTMSHPLLTRLPLQAARQEMAGSLEAIRREIPAAAPVLAYPDGDHNDDVAEAAKEAGFAAAFTTRRGINTTASDPFRLRRVNIGRGTKLSLLRAQLLPQLRHLPSYT